MFVLLFTLQMMSLPGFGFAFKYALYNIILKDGNHIFPRKLWKDNEKIKDNSKIR